MLQVMYVLYMYSVYMFNMIPSSPQPSSMTDSSGSLLQSIGKLLAPLAMAVPGLLYIQLILAKIKYLSSMKFAHYCCSDYSK